MYQYPLYHGLDMFKGLRKKWRILMKDHIESVVIGILTKGKIRIIHICCFENVKSSLV